MQPGDYAVGILSSFSRCAYSGLTVAFEYEDVDFDNSGDVISIANGTEILDEVDYNGWAVEAGRALQLQPNYLTEAEQPRRQLVFRRRCRQLHPRGGLRQPGRDSGDCCPPPVDTDTDTDTDDGSDTDTDTDTDGSVTTPTRTGRVMTPRSRPDVATGSSRRMS